jgi:hypothetical protein
MRSLFLALALLGCRNDGTVDDTSDTPVETGNDTSDTSDTSDTAPVDADNDGFTAPEDCDDADADVNPGASETCDGVDEDCDGEIDEGAGDASTFYADEDGDGFGDAEAPMSACAAPEGYVTDATDCDDADADTHPESVERCDDADADEDCDGLVDDEDEDVQDLGTFYLDADADGYGAEMVLACEAPEGAVARGGDCDDSRAERNPGELERCDPEAIDEDCDEAADDADTEAAGKAPVWADGDADGYGAGASELRCAPGAGQVSRAGDCDDANDTISPAATEVCDPGGVDEDCNGLANEGDPGVTGKQTFYYDADRDGFAGPESVTACAAPPNHYASSTDCDDADRNISPAATELCDDADVDEDCDGKADDLDDDPAGETTWFLDRDEDGHAGSQTVRACDAPAGAKLSATDCDDTSAAINPDAQEVCDPRNVDEDCDEVVDDGDPSATGKINYYRDQDGDTYGNALITRCDPLSGYVTRGGDCNDTNAAVNPGASEVCNGVDDDCNSSTPEPTNCRKLVFVTSQMYDGNLGGLAGADAKCQARAQAAGLPGTYMAWISTSQGSPSTRFTRSTTPYVLVNGTVIANNWNDLTDGTIAAMITVTETGGNRPVGNTSCAGSGNATAWSATNANGTRLGDSCSNFTSSAGSGLWGRVDSTTQFSSWCSGGTCAWLSPIYCFQQ